MRQRRRPLASKQNPQDLLVLEKLIEAGIRRTSEVKAAFPDRAQPGRAEFSGLMLYAAQPDPVT